MILDAFLGPLIEIEEKFNATSSVLFMRSHWHYSLYISLFYVLTIFSIKHYMKDRDRYDLRRPLMIWSMLLTLFSVYGFLVNGIAHWRYTYTHGWKASVCDSILREGRYGLWSFAFCFSKCPELCDTYFIVLRKQKLIFLHWYHHITVFIFSWYHYSYMVNSAQWFITMNYFVHAIMYFYYAVRASGAYRPPVWINMFITSLQLIQMIVGVYINIYIFWHMKSDPSWYCDGVVETTNMYVYWAFAMYFSYFALFSEFFYSSYFSKKSKLSSKDNRIGQTSSICNGHISVADVKSTSVPPVQHNNISRSLEATNISSLYGAKKSQDESSQSGSKSPSNGHSNKQLLTRNGLRQR